MKLSENFTFEELTDTNHIGLLEQNRLQAESFILELQVLANYVLEPIRDILGVPLKVNSGFRCRELNAVVGGVPTSQHVKGEAADIVPIGLTIEEAFNKLRAAKGLRYGQLIHEGTWIHVSLGAPWRSLEKSNQDFRL